MTRVSQPRPPVLQGVSQAQSSKGKGHHHSVKQQPMPSSSGGHSFVASTIQLLDLLHTLYTRVTEIFKDRATGVCVCVCVCVHVSVNNLYILYCPSFLSLSLSPSLSGGASQASAVRKDVTLSSLYFPEADKQSSSTGQLWYTAWCSLLQVRGGGGVGN